MSIKHRKHRPLCVVVTKNQLTTVLSSIIHFPSNFYACVVIKYEQNTTNKLKADIVSLSVTHSSTYLDTKILTGAKDIPRDCLGFILLYISPSSPSFRRCVIGKRSYFIVIITKIE